MPLEIDDQSIRIIGNNFKGLKFYDDLRTLQQEIYLKADNTLNIGGGTGGGGGSGGMEAHAIDGVLHVGTLADVQGPQFLLLDGTRPMTAALDMGTFAINNVGLVDGVDVSGHGARHAAAGGDAVDHDALTNFVANEHINHTSVTLTAGDGLTGGGDISANRTLAVGAGTLITVSADAVGIANGANYQFIGTGSGTAAAWQNLSTLAGAGLTHSAGVLAVGAGTLITVAADSVGITTGANYQFIGTGSGTAAAWQNLSTLAGAGLTHSAGVLAVGAGTLITVAADSVGITTGANYQFIGTGAGTAATWQNLSTLAGAGLTHSAGVLAVGAGTLITVAADSVGLSVGSAQGQAIVTGASPFTPAYSTTPTWAGLHTFHAGIDVNGTLEFQGAGTITSTASGNLTLSPGGDVILDPTGNDVLPNQNYDINLGMLSKKYLTLHCAELWVETLVAQDTIATIGGRILVGPTTTLTSDLAAGDTTIYVKHNQMASGDRVYLEADGKVEFMAITSAPGGAGPYSYSVTRNLDGTGANTWYAGDAVFNTGTTGDGFIDLYSIRGVKSATQYGPTIVGNVRNSSTYNDWTECWAIGNLNGLYGYGVDTYGVGLGKYSAADYITIDPTNGIRFLDASDVVQAQLSSSVWTLGRVAASFSNVQITAGALKLRTNTTDHVELTTAGTFWAGDTSTTERIQWDTTNGLRIYDANNAAVFASSPTGVTWLSTLAVSDSLGQSLFSAADGLLLLGPGCAITPTSWTSTRGQVATISGAFHQVAGRWAETLAILSEASGTNEHIDPTAQGTGNWTAGGTTPPTLTEQSTNITPYAGVYTAKIVWPAGGATGYAGCRVNGRNITIANGETWTFSMWIQSPDITEIAKISAYVGGGATYGTASMSDWVAYPNGWYRLYITFTNSSGGDQTERLIIYVNSSLSAALTTYIDGVQYEESIVPTSLIHGDAGTGYSWSGTAYASSSARAATLCDMSAYGATISNQNALSFSLWIQPQYAADGVWPQTAGNNVVFDLANAGGTDKISLFYNVDLDYFRVYVMGGYRLGSTTQTFAAGDWLHIIISLDFTNDDYRLYINGVLEDADDTALSAPTATTQWRIGSGIGGTGQCGVAFSEYAVFGRVLTAEEVAGLYAAARPLADMGALKRPGIYILDGEFDLRSSQTGARVQIDVNGVAGYSATTTKTFSLETDGDLFLGSNISAAATTALAVFANAQTYNSESLGTGDVLLGDNSVGKINLLWDVSEGDIILRRGNGAGAARITLDGSADSILIGQAAASQNNVLISSGAISIRNNTTERVGITAAGILTLKNSAGSAVFTFDASAGAEFTLPLTLATGGGIYQGTGTFASPTTGLKIWNDSGVGRIGGYNAGTIQWYASTDGKLYGGAGSIVIDAEGVQAAMTTAYARSRSYSITRSGTVTGSLYGYNVESPTYTDWLILESQPVAARNTYLRLAANAAAGYSAIVKMSAEDGTYSPYVSARAAFDDVIISAGLIDIEGDLGVAGGIALGDATLDPEAGVLWIDEISSTPGNPTAGANAKIYMKADKLVIMYNDGGTVRYKYLDLTGTGVTWVHTTSAP